MGRFKDEQPIRVTPWREVEGQSYGLDSEVRKLWRDLVEGRLIRMKNVTNLTERENILSLWSQIGALGESGAVELGVVRNTLNLLGGNEKSVPLLLKVWGIVNLCKASERLQPQEKRELWTGVSDAVRTEPDSVNYMILMGAWLAALGYRKPEEFIGVAQTLDNMTTKENAINRFGVQVAAARLSELIKLDRLRMGIMTVEISGQKREEYRVSHGSLGYPDTIMILDEKRIPSLIKHAEAVVVGVPEMSGVLTRRSLMAMVGVEKLRVGGDRRTHLDEYPNRTLSFVALDAMRQEERELGGDIPFVADSLTLWLAVRVTREVGERRSMNEIELRNIITKWLGRLQNRIDARSATGEITRQPGILRVALDEAVCRKPNLVGHSFGKASEQLTESVFGLLTSESRGKKVGIRTRGEIQSFFMEGVWASLSDSDRLAFAQIILEPNSHFWDRFSEKEQSILVDVFRHQMGVEAIPPVLLGRLYELVRNRLILKWETIRDKKGIEALILWNFNQ